MQSAQGRLQARVGCGSNTWLSSIYATATQDDARYRCSVAVIPSDASETVPEVISADELAAWERWHVTFAAALKEADS